MKILNLNNILLVHPLGYPVAEAKKDVSRMANIMPPLGLASMAAYLQEQGIDCTIVDCFAKPDSDELIKDYLLTQRPAFMGLSCTTSSFLDGIRIAKLAKSGCEGHFPFNASPNTLDIATLRNEEAVYGRSLTY